MIILVDENDVQKGIMSKMEVHKQGLLHRAFSVFIVNDNNELLLQQRALSKYHSPGLWTNTCCSHQREGETSIQAAKRRLKEEMGLNTSLEYLFSFIYKAKFQNGLIEHEYDHVIYGKSNKNPIININEVESWKWVSIELLLKDIDSNPESIQFGLKLFLIGFINF